VRVRLNGRREACTRGRMPDGWRWGMTGGFRERRVGSAWRARPSDGIGPSGEWRGEEKKVGWAGWGERRREMEREGWRDRPMKHFILFFLVLLRSGT
jgi:hypothetical protein